MNMYEKTIPELGKYIVKRFCMLVAKLTGFKAICLFLATVLLCLGIINSDIWLSVMLTVICTTSGLKIMDSLDIAGKVNQITNRGVLYEKNSNGNDVFEHDDKSISRRNSNRANSTTSKIITEGKSKLRDTLEKYGKE